MFQTSARLQSIADFEWQLASRYQSASSDRPRAMHLLFEVSQEIQILVEIDRTDKDPECQVYQDDRSRKRRS